MEILKKSRILSNLTQEMLAEKLGVDTFSVSRYEMNSSFPTFQILLKIINFFNISLDYLVLENNCCYPRNIYFLELSRKIDRLQDFNIKNNVLITTKTFLKEINDEVKMIRQDSIEKVELTANFHTNLKKIRTHKKIRQIDLAKVLNISPALLGMYEKKNYPSIEKLIAISNKLNLSMHALATGRKLFFDFQDRAFGKTMLFADHLLSLEDQKFLIKFMGNILLQSPQK